jgi:chromosome segregation ATPase
MIRQLAHRLGYVSGAAAEAKEQKLREQIVALRKEREREQEARKEDRRRHELGLAKLNAEHERRLAKSTEARDAKSARERAILEEQLAATVRDGRLLEERVASAVRDLDIAREQLMAIEVKLDILEGAANVLDGRLRAARAEDKERRRQPVDAGCS